MDTGYRDQPVTFRCGDDTLVGLVSRPSQPRGRGILIVVGGAQYRAGSHRQFVLLARALAQLGIAVMRFDIRGMGDSTGELRSFEAIDADVRAAVDTFFATVSELREVVLWGLCDAASAALFYAHRDRRVTGLVLLNPWVRTQAGEAQAYLRHYYIKRLKDPGFWQHALRGRLRPLASLKGVATQVRLSLSGPSETKDTRAAANSGEDDRATPLPGRMANGLERFTGNVLVILSGNDLTAKEFTDAVSASSQWRRLLAQPRITRHELPDANHTFSSRDSRNRVTEWTHTWVTSW